MIIDPRDYPGLTFRWRVFERDSFIGYLEARCPELAKIMATFVCMVDLEHRVIELL